MTITFPPPVTDGWKSGKRLITSAAFFERFTDAEGIALEAAGWAATNAAAKVRYFVGKWRTAGYINLDKSKVRNILTDWEAAGYLAAGRAAAIVDTPLTDEEKFR